MFFWQTIFLHKRLFSLFFQNLTFSNKSNCLLILAHSNKNQMKIKEIISRIEEFAPLSYQENYDNAGIQVGNIDAEVDSVLLTLDITEEVLKEAIEKKAGLIISHHPLIFGGIKKLTGKNSSERIILEAIKNNIAIYSAHTNLDSTWNGVNVILAKKLGLENISVLKPVSGTLKKLVTFVPSDHADKVREALFNAGAGQIGNYDSCSYNLEGNGTFRANEDASPFVGNVNELHTEKEVRIETIFPQHLKHKVVSALIKNHPYEEVAFDIYPLENDFGRQGIGAIGDLPEGVSEEEFLSLVKTKLNCQYIRHSPKSGKKIKKVAVCGGSGSFLIHDSIIKGASAFVTGDLKYHQFAEPEDRLLLVDAGHFETERHTVEIFYDFLTKNFPTFAFYFSEVNTNPVNYF